MFSVSAVSRAAATRIGLQPSGDFRALIKRRKDTVYSGVRSLLRPPSAPTRASCVRKTAKKKRLLSLRIECAAEVEGRSLAASLASSVPRVAQVGCGGA
ncbi:hypothetical protein MRX96_015210 [Rhipicephalus microplus]